MSADQASVAWPPWPPSYVTTKKWMWRVFLGCYLASLTLARKLTLRLRYAHFGYKSLYLLRRQNSKYSKTGLKLLQALSDGRWTLTSTVARTTCRTCEDILGLSEDCWRCTSDYWLKLCSKIHKAAVVTKTETAVTEKTLTPFETLCTMFECDALSFGKIPGKDDFPTEVLSCVKGTFVPELHKILLQH